jgi:O-antigen/teichoic acid export membrane protein
MSRVQKLARGLATGYVASVVNILYTLASVPLALHYLTRAEFALWALVTQIAGYLGLIDLGMTGSVYRILIDHKDTRGDGRYGVTFLAGWIVFTIQGALIAACGIAVSPWLAHSMKVPAMLAHDLHWLIAGECTVLGFAFAMQIFTIPLLSHQRQDVTNLVSAGQFFVSFGTLWLGFALGWKVYAMLLADIVGNICSVSIQAAASRNLGLLPHREEWRRPAWTDFRAVFVFGGDLFLLSVGWQMVAASQVIIITRTLGIEAAAIWVVCSKAFTLAQQFVWRILDLSGPALSEMFVRGEKELFQKRFRDVLVLSASLAITVGGIVAMVNRGFIDVWTHGRISWAPQNDAMMSLLLVSYSITRCLTLWVGITKEVLGMRYIYFIEGVLFVTGAWLTAPHYGLFAIIATSLAANVLCSGAYGLWRTAAHFKTSPFKIMVEWLSAPWKLLLLLIPSAILIGNITQQWPSGTQFGANGLLIGTLAAFLFWRFGMPAALREELTDRFRNWRKVPVA